MMTTRTREELIRLTATYNQATCDKDIYFLNVDWMQNPVDSEAPCATPTTVYVNWDGELPLPDDVIAIDGIAVIHTVENEDGSCDTYDEIFIMPAGEYILIQY